MLVLLTLQVVLQFSITAYTQVKGLYNLEVRVHNYTNLTGKCPGCVEVLSPEPGCCDLYGELSSCGDFYRCDTYFTYVLRVLGSNEMGENCTTSNSDKYSSSRRMFILICYFCLEQYCIAVLS